MLKNIFSRVLVVSCLLLLSFFDHSLAINIFTSTSAVHTCAVFLNSQAFVGFRELDWSLFLPSCIYIWMAFYYSSASPETPSALPLSPASVPELMLFTLWVEGLSHWGHPESHNSTLQNTSRVDPSVRLFSTKIFLIWTNGKTPSHNDLRVCGSVAI